MEEKKLSKLRFTLVEVTGCKKVDPDCELDILGKKYQARLHVELVLNSLEITENNAIGISLKKSDFIIGAGSVSFQTLFGNDLAGTTTRWVKIKSEEFPLLKIKISATLNLADKPKNARNNKRASLRGENGALCPFLERLQNGKCENTEPFDNLWRNRGNVDKNMIRISIEPDNQTALDGFEFNPQDFEGITMESLKKLPGSQLKAVLRGICQEARQFENIAKHLTEKNEEFKEIIEKRRGMEIKSQRDIGDIREGWVRKMGEFEKLKEEYIAKNKGLIENRDRNRKLEAEMECLKAEFLEIQRENIKVAANCIYFRLIQSAKKQYAELENKFSQEKDSIKETEQKTRNDIEKTKSEIEVIRKQLGRVNEEYQTSHKENDEIKRKISEIKAKLASPEAVKENVSTSLQNYKNVSHARDEINNSLVSLSQRISTQNKEIASKYQLLLDSKSSLMHQLQEIEHQIYLKSSEIAASEKNLLSDQSSKSSKSFQHAIRADLSSLSTDLLNLNTHYTASQKTLLSDLDVGSSLLAESSETVLNESKQIDSIIELIDSKEEELEGLKNTMGEVKRRQIVYVPVKSDKIDIALSDYLETHEVPIKFSRMEAGLYMFGSKKVNVKLENEKLRVVIGGGYMSIDEFISIYVPLEMEKSQSSPTENKGLVALSSYAGGLSPTKAAQKMYGAFDSLSKSPKKG